QTTKKVKRTLLRFITCLHFVHDSSTLQHFSDDDDDNQRKIFCVSIEHQS
ncbi:17270_t:CDS:1, partial [Funneliformis caledonium]